MARHKNYHKRTWKEFGKRVDPHKSFTEQWQGVGNGRFWKGLLAKVRRRAAKEEIRAELEETRPHLRNLDGVEGEVNWKGW
jgi:hypothetical protein